VAAADPETRIPNTLKRHMDQSTQPETVASKNYVHGYTEEENDRLRDQSQTLAELLHHDTRFPRGARVLEAGCGVGAQTVLLACNSPEARFTSVDISSDSLRAAEAAVRRARLTNVTFQTADLFHLPFPPESFDHVFVCFVLEHLPNPVAALRKLKDVIRPGGTLTAIEGDHGSTFYHPQSAAAWRVIQCLIDLQARLGGDALIGRRLYPLLKETGFAQITVSPRFVYADASRPDWVEGFTHKTYIAMVEGVRESAVGGGMISRADWENGLADLRKTAGPDGTFSYTFFKGVAVK
jgi:SAM-dependent methyltransferase